MVKDTLVSYKVKDTTIFKIPSEIDISAAGVPVDINYTAEDPGEKNKNEVDIEPYATAT